MITLDWTFLASGITFLLTLWALNRFLFRPLFRVLDRRAELTTETQKSASSKLDYHTEMLEKYAERIKKGKQKGYQLSEAMRRDAMEARQDEIARARADAEGQLKEAREQIRSEIRSAEESLKKDAEDIAQIIAAHVLEKT